MSIIQITDLHVGKEGEIPHGVDVRNNFLSILEVVKKRNPKHLILTGDLCLYDGELEIYKWIKSHLDKLDISYDIIAGNHDDSEMIASIFGLEDHLKEGELFYKKKIHNKTCLFLDSGRGFLSNNQLIWIEEQLKSIKDQFVIFMHHPPVYGGVAFMEGKHAMKERQKLQEVLFNIPNRISLFCGHYHVEKTICQNNLTVFITPSCYVQIDSTAQDFKVDHHRIALREIDFGEELILTEVRYI